MRWDKYMARSISSMSLNPSTSVTQMMFPSKSFLSLLLFAVSLGNSATVTPSPRTLEITRRRNFPGFSNISDADLAYWTALKPPPRRKTRGNRKRDVITAINGGMEYMASVGIGSPPIQYSLLIDTGSAVTWVGANPANPYVRTATGQATGRSISVLYDAGSASGPEYTDTITLSPTLVIQSQSIVSATDVEGIAGVDGVLGLGPVTLSEATVVDDPTADLPTVMNNLVDDGTITSEILGIYFAPTTTLNNANGELSFGQPLGHREHCYVPITTTEDADQYWGIDMSIDYGGASMMGLTAGIVDTGNTPIFLATEAFNAYAQATGGVLDPNTNFLTITLDQYNALQNLDFKIGGNTYSLPPNGQIWPRALNEILGVGDDGITMFLVVQDLGVSIGHGLDFVLGYTFHERFYVVLDATDDQIGFATTAQTGATIN